VRSVTSILIVRLGALGDIVHGAAAAAALRAAYPDARLDWLVDVRHRHLLDLVPILSHRIAIDTRAWRGPTGVPSVVRALRAVGYDFAIDLQGLLKSAMLAHLSGAQRVIGFTRSQVREGLASAFYNIAIDPGPARHVIDRGLALAAAAGASTTARTFPFTVPQSDAPARARAALGLAEGESIAVLNPGGAWPNKRWPADRFGALAQALRDRAGLRSIVLWGPGEEALARAVCEASGGAAAPAPRTTLDDLVAIVARARLVVSGDTGPLHLAAAVGAPIVGLYGPTDPARNGPWATDDVVVSRSAICQCSHQRRCHAQRWCLLDAGVDEVIEASLRRLSTSPGAPRREPGAGGREPK
jgi:heptosyltransferase I